MSRPAEAPPGTPPRPESANGMGSTMSDHAPNGWHDGRESASPAAAPGHCAAESDATELKDAVESDDSIISVYDSSSGEDLDCRDQPAKPPGSSRSPGEGRREHPHDPQDCYYVRWLKDILNIARQTRDVDFDLTAEGTPVPLPVRTAASGDGRIPKKMSIEEAERKAAWSGLFDAIDGTVRRALDRSQGTQARYGRRGHSERLEVSDRDDGEYDYDANGSCGGGGCGGGGRGSGSAGSSGCGRDDRGSGHDVDGSCGDGGCI